MLYIFRLIITVIYSILVCVFGSIYCLFSPRNPKHVATFGHMFWPSCAAVWPES
ncbi:1-acylglycerol-3-phosphate O-acyltransferase [Escherichia coli]|nr:1-acylglycerol-3-phosphate O-acyltransferase [Escherichia coli]